MIDEMDDDEELPPPFYDCESEYDMKQQELDEFRGRLDERTLNTYRILVDFRKECGDHLIKLNDAVAKNTTSCGKHGTGIKNIWVVLTLIVIVLAGALGLGIAF